MQWCELRTTTLDVKNDVAKDEETLPLDIAIRCVLMNSAPSALITREAADNAAVGFG